MDNFTDCGLSTAMINAGEWLYFIAYSVILPIYFVFGLAANIVLLIAFRKQSKDEAPYQYQVFLTVSKTMEVVSFGGFLITMEWFSGFFGGGVQWFQRQYSLMFVTFRVGAALHSHFLTSSVLLAAAMAADRVFALAWPIRYHKVNHGRHQLVAAATCFALPAAASVSYGWVFRVIPHGDHFIGALDESFAESIIGQVCPRLGVVLRLGGLAALVTLNVLMILQFRKRAKSIALMTNNWEKEKALKAADKTLMLLNLWQSILMCVNQIPFSLAQAVLFIAPSFPRCFSRTIRPTSDMCIFITDSVDLIVVMLISEKMRGIVMKTVTACCKKDQVIPI